MELNRPVLFAERLSQGCGLVNFQQWETGEWRKKRGEEEEWHV